MENVCVSQGSLLCKLALRLGESEVRLGLHKRAGPEGSAVMV